MTVRTHASYLGRSLVISSHNDVKRTLRIQIIGCPTDQYRLAILRPTLCCATASYKCRYEIY